MSRKIGVLALQGDFAKHEDMLQSFTVETVRVKRPEQLQGCDGLIIPGGESTTLTKLMHRYGFYESLREFAQCHSIMGTCAGLILVAAHVDDPRVDPLHLIDIAVTRNAYGRQIDSFITDADVPFLGNGSAFRAVFIRAPQIEELGAEVEILIELQGKPVMVRNKTILALAFHPELTNDPRIHQYFLDQF